MFVNDLQIIDKEYGEKRVFLKTESIETEYFFEYMDLYLKNDPHYFEEMKKRTVPGSKEWNLFSYNYDANTNTVEEPMQTIEKIEDAFHVYCKDCYFI